jgi:hypothetical protein
VAVEQGLPARSVAVAEGLQTIDPVPAAVLVVPLGVGIQSIMCAVTIAELWRRGQLGWPRRFPIAQFPNPPLLLAFAGWGLAAAAGGTAHDVGGVVFTVGLCVWAGQEAVSGVNWFRHLLGLGVLIWIVAGLAANL